MADRDPLGRPGVRPSFTERRRTEVLTDDAISQIAHDVRTKPLTEVGRHVFPLIRHIAEMSDRECRTCRWWVPHNLAHAHVGECLLPASEGAPVRLGVIMEPDGLAEAHPALVTAFDWGCRSWQVRGADPHEAQCKAG